MALCLPFPVPYRPNRKNQRPRALHLPPHGATSQVCSRHRLPCCLSVRFVPVCSCGWLLGPGTPQEQALATRAASLCPRRTATEAGPPPRSWLQPRRGAWSHRRRLRGASGWTQCALSWHRRAPSLTRTLDIIWLLPSAPRMIPYCCCCWEPGHRGSCSLSVPSSCPGHGLPVLLRALHVACSSRSFAAATSLCKAE